MTDRDELTCLLSEYEFDSTFCNICERPDDDCRNCGNERLADYLLEHGIIVPPCHIGSVLYTKSGSKRIVERIEVGRVYNPERYFYIFTAYSNKTLSKGYLRFFDYEIGKTVFLTREEAEKALKECEQNERL